MPSRYRWVVVPRADRFPKLWIDWLRLGLVVLLAVTATGVVVFRQDLGRLATCNDGWPGTAAWSAAA